jgi:hypothetical protein
MTIELFRNEILRFISHPQAEVLVISGKWGVGKTYAWNRFLAEAKQRNLIAPSHYAYVSLFGLAGLEEVKAAVFQNTVTREKAGVPADMSTLEGAVKSATSLWRKGSALARLLPPLADYSAALERIGFFSVRNQIVCIDDLERKSKSLEMRDILGLISFLREQRGCKAVILLNDEKLAGDDEEFHAQLEKIADTVLRFEPTPEEAATIGINASTSFHASLHSHSVALGIVNIRTIKKLERLATRLEEELGSYHPNVLRQAIHSAALFGFARYQPDVAPTTEFIRSLNRFEGLLAEEGQALPHPEWRAMLQGFDFGQLDEFDEVILTGIENGHFDTDALRREAIKLDERLRLVDEDESFSAAWELYHGSFDANADEVMDRLADAVRRTPRAITPTNLSGTISLLKELGWQGNTNDLIWAYVDSREEERSFWDLDASTFGENVQDPDVRQAFAERLAAVPETRDVATILTEIGKENSWHSDDVKFLAAQDVDIYCGIFKRLRDKELRRAIAGGLKFRDIGNADQHMQTVTQHVEEALRRIGAESPINRRRVRQKGVDVPEPGGQGA